MAFVPGRAVAMSWAFPGMASNAVASLRDSLINGRAFLRPLWSVDAGAGTFDVTREDRACSEDLPGGFVSSDALPKEMEPVTEMRVQGAERHGLYVGWLGFAVFGPQKGFEEGH